MNIHICGSRGIPNNYGGFEQCAERLAVLLCENGHEVTVYNPDYHSYQENTFGKVKISRQWNPEHTIGTLGNFIYDYRCMQSAFRANADIVLVLGYTTASVFFPLLRNKKSAIITNMDGLEWKRDKWNFAVKIIAKGLERLGAKYSDFLVADNREIQQYLKTKHQRSATYIAYGADIFQNPDPQLPESYNCSKEKYDLLIARLEKENNIEMILDGVLNAVNTVPFLVIGNHKTAYGNYLKSKYRKHTHIRFIGSVYNIGDLNNLRYHSRFYFHGHSVGGTNPSLLEAMASSAFIIANDNPFNKDVLGENACYFSSSADISRLLNNSAEIESNRQYFISNNLMKIERAFNWKFIAAEYEKLCREACSKVQGRQNRPE